MTALQVWLGVALLMIGSFASLDAQTPYCVPSSGSDGLTPPLPDLPDVFSTRIEINYLMPTQQSQSVRQQFDYNKRLASIFFQTNNTETRLYFDYASDQIHLTLSSAFDDVEGIIPGTTPVPVVMACESLPLTGTPVLNQHFGVVRENATYLRPKSVYDVLRFRNGNFLWAYEGTETVRGIPCDSWISCQYLPETQSNYTVKFYFSRFNYSMPHWSAEERYSRVPVRAVYQGVRLEQGVSKPFNEIFDYFDFVAGRAEPSGFYTPSNVVCLGRKNSQSIPVNIDRRFSTSEEIIEGETIEYLKNLNIDEDLEIVKYELRPGKRRPETYYTYNPLTIIHDYNVGVSYAYNHVVKNCTITGITNSSFDEDANYTNSLANEHSFIVRIKSPKSLLFLDRDYVYTGERYSSEGLRVKSFLSNETNLYGTNTVIEYEFSSDAVFGDDSDIEDVVPVSYRYQVVGVNTAQSNFYDFKTSVTSPHEFSTAMCFQDGENMNIRMTFPFRKYSLTADQLNDKSWLEAYVYKLFAVNTRESFTRFSRPKISVDADDGNLYVRFEVLPSPPPMALFTEIPGKWYMGTTLDYYYSLGSPEKCAAFCVERDDCLSFDYSNYSTSCFLNSGHAATDEVSEQESYMHYSRNTLKGFGSKPPYKIYEQLMREMANGNVYVEIRASTASNPNTFVKVPASKIEIVRSSEGAFGGGAGVFSLTRFELKYKNKKFASVQNLREYESLSIDECAAACIDEPMFECAAFDYCFTNDRCRVSSKVASDNEGDFVEDFCQVYSQNQLFHYRRFPGRYAVNNNDINYKNVENAGACADKCDKADKIHCRSFNYCEQEKTCYISDSHLVDATDTPVLDLLCTHYSRDFLSDFEFTSSANVALEAEIIYTGNTLDECAGLCVSADGFKCTSMDYCAKSKTCMLNSDKKIPKNETDAGVSRDQCNNYLRKYFYKTSAGLNEKPTSDNSSAVLLGLSLTFVVLAIAGGAIGGHIIIKKKFSN